MEMPRRPEPCDDAPDAPLACHACGAPQTYMVASGHRYHEECTAGGRRRTIHVANRRTDPTPRPGGREDLADTSWPSLFYLTWQRSLGPHHSAEIDPLDLIRWLVDQHLIRFTPKFSLVSLDPPKWGAVSCAKLNWAGAQSAGGCAYELAATARIAARNGQESAIFALLYAVHHTGQPRVLCPCQGLLGRLACAARPPRRVLQRHHLAGMSGPAPLRLARQPPSPVGPLCPLPDGRKQTRPTAELRPLSFLGAYAAAAALSWHLHPQAIAGRGGGIFRAPSPCGLRAL